MFFNEDSDTICAQSSPPGIGGISVIRVSGSNSFEIIKQHCPWLDENISSHQIKVGLFYSLNNLKLNTESAAKAFDTKKDTNNSKSFSIDNPIDQVVLSFFKKNKSFTGEETVEISCHGSPIIVSQILESLQISGCRLAKPGEFTFRAFHNGRIDLVQAESVIGLIHSNSKKSALQALRQLSGELSKDIHKIENDLLSCLANIEVSIDFSTEGLDILSDGKIVNKLKVISSEIFKLISGYKSGKVIKDGLRVVLSGQPNVGKSSLLNLLLEEEKAIVTDVAGTTRDLVEGVFFVDGIKVNLIDTAGIRESNDKVEKIGIERSINIRSESDVIIYVIDSSKSFNFEDEVQLSSLNKEQLIILFNKGDIVNLNENQTALDVFKSSNFYKTFTAENEFLNERMLIVSAFDKRSKNDISSLISKVVKKNGFQDDSLISQARHFEALNKAFDLLENSIANLGKGDGVEYVAFDLKEALILIQSILGKSFDDQIMDKVFKEFCIGK